MGEMKKKAEYHAEITGTFFKLEYSGSLSSQNTMIVLTDVKTESGKTLCGRIDIAYMPAFAKVNLIKGSKLQFPCTVVEYDNIVRTKDGTVKNKVYKLQNIRKVTVL